MSHLDEEKTPLPEPETSEVSIIDSPRPDESQQPEDEADSFVAREASRRKRLLRFYLILLAVPVALAVAVLIFGRSDRQVVMETIQTEAPAIVQREVGNQIQPVINAEVKSQIAPTLNELHGLGQKTEALSQSQKEIETSLRAETESMNARIRDEVGLVGTESRLRLQVLEENNQRKLREIENRIKTLEERIDKLPRSGRILDDPILKQREPQKSPQ